MAPGARSKFGAPKLEPDVFRKQMYCTEECVFDIVGTFRRPRSHSTLPAVIWHPHSDSAPGNCGPLTPSSLRPCVERKLLVSQYRETVIADSGKPRTFILCEKKHELIFSNVSTSLKNPLLVRL